MIDDTMCVDWPYTIVKWALCYPEMRVRRRLIIKNKYFFWKMSDNLIFFAAASKQPKPVWFTLIRT